MNTFRNAVAWGSVFVAFGIFGAYCCYGAYLDWKLLPYASGERPPKAHRYNPSHHTLGAEPWLLKNQEWERRFNRVWLGCVLGGNLIYWLAKP